MKVNFVWICVCVAMLVAARPVLAADSSAQAPPPAEQAGKSLTELNKELTNPISSLWSLSFQQNNFMLDMGAGKPDHWNSNLVFQPVLPVALTEDWNLITRPVLTRQLQKK